MLKIENYDLSTCNTFRMKVKCACYIEYESVAELETMDWDKLPQPIRSIGEGSNILFTGDFPGTILHSKINHIKYVDLGLDEVPIMLGAGVKWDDFVSQTCGHGLWGAENLSLIPGQAGGATVQNIGAYGVEIKDLISGVVCFDLQSRKKVKFNSSECEFGYRDSLFKRHPGRFIVTSILLRLSRKAKPRLEYKGIRAALGVDDKNPAEGLSSQMVREAIINLRNEKLPDPAQIGSAGSFFKNPVLSAIEFARIIDIARRDFGEDIIIPHYINADGSIKIPAAWMIERCGFKGAVEGGAAVYDKQALVLINATGSASPAEVLALENRIIEGVKEKFNVCLQAEVEHI